MVLDHTWLQREVTLGCRTIQATSVDQPIVATGGAVTLVTIGLDRSSIVEPTDSAVVVNLSQEPRRIAMKSYHPTDSAPAPV